MCSRLNPGSSPEPLHVKPINTVVTRITTGKCNLVRIGTHKLIITIWDLQRRSAQLRGQHRAARVWPGSL